MISNPKHGWCNFQIGDFKGTPSYLTNVPLDLLEAFINYYLLGYGVVVFDEEGSLFTLVLSKYFSEIFIIEEKDKPILHDFSSYYVENLAKELIKDIKNDLTGWSEFYGYDHREEIIYQRDTLRDKIVKLEKLLEET